MVTALRFENVAGLAARMLLRSSFRSPRSWSSAVVVFDGDTRRVSSRGDYAAWLRHNDLLSLAVECLARRVPRGCALLWLACDGPDGTGVRFVVLDLATGLVRS